MKKNLRFVLQPQRLQPMAGLKRKKYLSKSEKRVHAITILQFKEAKF